MNDTITLTGNIATIPEHKKILDGVPVTSFRLATSHRRLDKATGQWVDGEASYYTVQLFRQLAEHAVLSLSRGDRVIVTGRLKVREWDNGTRKGTTVELDAEAIGHDLKFGTSRFTRSTASRPPVDPRGADEWSAPGVGDEGSSAGPADEWATTIPGSGDDTPGGSPGRDESTAPALATAGDTPF